MKINENRKFKIFRKVGRLCGAGDPISNGNTYYVMSSDGGIKITLFYRANGEINPLINGTTNPIIKSSFPKF